MNNFDEMNSEEWNNGCFKGSLFLNVNVTLHKFNCDFNETRFVLR